ncbi:MAG: response regulator [Deltaproteobacteria bacterium]|nr:response regulator [Deltaproteobacteria bacterium]
MDEGALNRSGTPEADASITIADESVRILCVDDEKGVLRSIERVFLDEEYEILKATSGKEGLQILKEVSPIQIVLSDYRMPEMNGVDFLREVCKGWPETVRIVLSGYADTVAVVEAVNEGQIYKFLAKPWNDDELRFAVSNALERYFLYQKNRRLTEELQKRNNELASMNENLEQRVEQRTEDLLLRNRVLSVSQHLLQSLPVGVLGLDMEGLIVYCNDQGEKIFPGKVGEIIGKERTAFFSEPLNAFIDKIREKTCASGRLQLHEVVLRLKGAVVKHEGNQEGIVVVVEEESGNG